LKTLVLKVIILLCVVFCLVGIIPASASSLFNTHKYDLYFYKYSKHYFGPSFDYKWFKAQGIAESGLNQQATSPVGAVGVMQVMPTTAKEIRSKQVFILDIKNNPEWNIAAGIYYDRYLWGNWKARRSFEDRLRFMFASYNAGLGSILKVQEKCVVTENTCNCNNWDCILQYKTYNTRWKHEETIPYVDRIFKYYYELNMFTNK